MRRIARSIGVSRGIFVCALVVASCGALFVLGAGDLRTAWTDPAGKTVSAIALASGLVAGAFLTMSALLSYANWRLAPDVRVGWLVAASVLVSSQSLSLAMLAANQRPTGLVSPVWPLHVVALTSLIAVGMVVLSSLQHRSWTVDPLVAGLGTGLITATLVLAPPAVGGVAPVPTWVLISVIGAIHLLGAFLVVRNGVLPRPAAVLMAVTVLAIGAGHFLTAGGLDGTLWDVILSISRAVVGAAWLVAIHVSLSSDAAHEKQRSDELENTLMATVGSERDQRERLHELRSTLAGLVNAAGMLDRHEVNDLAGQHLQQTIYRELTRMQRLLSEEKDTPTVIDLDVALDVILDLQRLKGRHVELHGSGDSVRARYDGLAEVVNILLDNAATHGGSDTSVIEVTRCDDDRVEIAVTDSGRGIPPDDREWIFGWGERGHDSPGQGIGLNLARRLTAEDGGSLTFAEPVVGGSSFVISLPAPRQSVENDPWL